MYGCLLPPSGLFLLHWVSVSPLISSFNVCSCVSPECVCVCLFVCVCVCVSVTGSEKNAGAGCTPAWRQTNLQLPPWKSGLPCLAGHQNAVTGKAHCCDLAV